MSYVHYVRIRVGQLRQIIRKSLGEVAGGATRPVFNDYIRNALSPDRSDREQLGWLATSETDIDDETGLPDHLLEPAVSREDCYGPVPPNAEDPRITQDPFVRDSSPNPTPPIMR